MNWSRRAAHRHAWPWPVSVPSQAIAKTGPALCITKCSIDTPFHRTQLTLVAAAWSQGKETPEDLGGIQAGLALQSHQLQVPRKPVEYAQLLTGLFRHHRTGPGPLLRCSCLAEGRGGEAWQRQSVSSNATGDHCCVAAPPAPAAGHP